MKAKIAFAMIMGSITTGIISFTLIAVNVGFIERFLFVWMKSWALSYVLAIPAILIISPKVQHLVDYLFGEKVKIKQE
jgi:hypothetical protein